MKHIFNQNSSSRLFFLFTLLSCALTPSLSNANGDNMPLSLAPMLKNAMPAIVNIAVQGELPAPPDEDADQQQPQQPQQPQPRLQHGPQAPKPRKFEGLASGVIIDPVHGFIIT